MTSSKVILILQQIAAVEKSTSPTYISRAQCAALARTALEELGVEVAELVADSESDIPDTSDARRPTAVSTYVVNTDGACKQNPGPSAYGFAIEHEGVLVFKEGKFLGDGTNQTAELSAAIAGISAIPEGSSFHLIADSKYVLQGLTDWRKGWESRGMRSASGDLVKNLNLWKLLYEVADARKLLSTKWVKGHSGDPMNELCDLMANKAIKTKGIVN